MATAGKGPVVKVPAVDVEEISDSISEADSYVEPPLAAKPPAPTSKVPTKTASTAMKEAIQPAQ